jgi:putative ABC transport system permease protein
MAIDFYTTSIRLEERAYVDNQFGTVVSMLLGLAMLVATVGGIGLMGALGISVVERRREIGVMRSIGAPSRIIITLFVMEGVLQGVMSWLLAVPLSFVLARPLARALGQTMIEVDLDYAFNYPFVFVWLGAVLAISILASVLPARDAIGVSVRESLAYA